MRRASHWEAQLRAGVDVVTDGGDLVLTTRELQRGHLHGALRQ